MKDLRRKQFFNFMSDFFEKFEQGNFSSKTTSLITFSEEEKEEWIKRYFKKYYMENKVLKEEIVEMKIDADAAAKKRTCSCTVGEIDPKTGELIAPTALGKAQKTVKVKM